MNNRRFELANFEATDGIFDFTGVGMMVANMKQPFLSEPLKLPWNKSTDSARRSATSRQSLV